MELEGSSLSTMGTHEGQPFVFVSSVSFVPAIVPARPSGSRERLKAARPGLRCRPERGKTNNDERNERERMAAT